MTEAQAALTQIPVVFAQLDADGREMLIGILQATFEAGVEAGINDGVLALREKKHAFRAGCPCDNCLSIRSALDRPVSKT